MLSNSFLKFSAKNLARQCHPEAVLSPRFSGNHHYKRQKAFDLSIKRHLDTYFPMKKLLQVRFSGCGSPKFLKIIEAVTLTKNDEIGRTHQFQTDPLSSTQGPRLFNTQNPSIQHQNPSVPYQKPPSSTHLSVPHQNP